MSLEKLRQKRSKWVESSRENGFEDGINRLLTDLYPDNAHFIYELLQNAEDAKATEVRFILEENGLEFEHNGERLFSVEDIDSITSIGTSTKKDEPTSIGKFGVGFKSVFAYTLTPEITSGPFHFRIRDLVVPETYGLDLNISSDKTTRFSFPFDNLKKTPEKARSEIERNLLQLNESSLLFLKNIKKIEYLLPDSSFGSLERNELIGNKIVISVQHPGKPEPKIQFYLRFEKIVEVNDETDSLKSCRLAVAFGLRENQDNWRIKPVKSGKVCIYFPADKETSNLFFHIHAPFASTVARDSVRDCEANNTLRDHLADLIADSMIDIRDQGLLTIDFLAILPNAKDNLSSFYSPILEKLVEAFQNEDLTPMKQGGYSAANGIFKGSAQLSELVNDHDLAKIFGEDYFPPMWVANPNQKNQREDSFLSSLGINEWRIEDLIRALLVKDSDPSIEWISKKSIEWHQSLYALLGNYLSNTPAHLYTEAQKRKSELERLCIVRISDGSYRIGSDCFFPSTDVEHDDLMPRVLKGIFSSGNNEQQQRKAKKFLIDVGVRDVGEAEEVEIFLKNRYSQEAVGNNNFTPDLEDIIKFNNLLEKDTTQAGLFEDCYIFKLNNGKWGKPIHAYLDSPFYETGLSHYYNTLGDRSNRWALSHEYNECGIDIVKIGEFAKKVGVQTKLTPTKQYISEDHPQISILNDRGNWSVQHGINEDYDLTEIDLLFTKIDFNVSKLIWNTIKELPDSFLLAQYCSNSRYNKKTAHSTLVHKLKNNEWVPQNEYGTTNYVKPVDADSKLLPEGFAFDKGWKWLQAVEFGRSIKQREESEIFKTAEYQKAADTAISIGFGSLEEAKEMAALKKQDPEGFKRWQETNKVRPSFPIKPIHNQDLRHERLKEQLTNSPGKEYEKRERNVRMTKESIDQVLWLREKYTNESGQMVCQICKEEMPFIKRNGEYYFEAIEALSIAHFPLEHEAQFLALCPLCAAMYNEFVKKVEGSMIRLKQEIVSSDNFDVPLMLGQLETSIRFVEKHYYDLKTIIEAGTNIK